MTGLFLTFFAGGGLNAGVRVMTVFDAVFQLTHCDERTDWLQAAIPAAGTRREGCT